MAPPKSPFDDLLNPQLEQQATANAGTTTAQPTQPLTNPYAAPGGQQAPKPAVSQAQPAAPAAKPQAANSGAMVGGFINWSDRMSANADAAKKQAAYLAQQGQQQVSAATGAADTATREYTSLLGTQAMDPARVKRLNDLINMPGTSPTARANYIKQLEAIQGGLNQATGLNDSDASLGVGDRYNAALDQADAAREYIGNLGSVEGRQGIFQKEAEKAGQYSTGLLDAALSGVGGGQFQALADDKFEDRITGQRDASKRAYDDLLAKNKTVRDQAGGIVAEQNKPPPPAATPEDQAATQAAVNDAEVAKFMQSYASGGVRKTWPKETMDKISNKVQEYYAANGRMPNKREMESFAKDVNFSGFGNMVSGLFK